MKKNRKVIEIVAKKENGNTRNFIAVASLDVTIEDIRKKGNIPTLCIVRTMESEPMTKDEALEFYSIRSAMLHFNPLAAWVKSTITLFDGEDEKAFEIKTEKVPA